MRILKFLGVFLAVLLLVFFIVFGFNLNALVTLFENSEDVQEGYEWVEKTNSLKGLTEYINEQPERVSLTSTSLSNPDSSIRYNEHTPRTMGRLSNIFLLIEYARQVENGDLNPNEQVPIEEVSRYQLPYVDASGHQNTLSALHSEDKISPDNTVAISDLVEKAIVNTDLATADFLYFYFGSDRLENLMDRLQLEQTESLLPFSGLYIVLKANLHNYDYNQWSDSLAAMPRSRFDSLTVSYADSLFSDKNFRSNVTDSFDNDEGLEIGFRQQRDALAFFPKTTSSEMARIMRDIQQEELLSPEVSRRIKNIMDWQMESRRLQNDFTEYGALYDSRLGMVNGIDYGKSVYSEEPFAQAIFFDELQIAFWFHMSSNLMHQDFQQRLIWDPALREATITEISSTSSNE